MKARKVLTQKHRDNIKNGQQKRWASISKTKRSEQGTIMAQARMDALTDRQKKRLGRNLTKARLEKTS